VIFILREDGDGFPRVGADLRVVHSRRHPPLAERELFCVGSEGVLQGLREAGNVIVCVHDGWYPDELGGGVAVWGNARYWEVRSTPFDVVDQG